MDQDDFLATVLRNPVNELIADELLRLALPDAWTTYPYRTTPEKNPGLRRGGLMSFFKKQCASLPT